MFGRLRFPTPQACHNDPTTTGRTFERLVGIMARLRAPGGCPWDREQNFDTIKPYLLEETYEVLDAIDQRDWPGLAEELGDLLLQAVFFAQMASEEGKFRIDDSLDAIAEKLIRRHPHVFGDGTRENRRRREAPLGRNQSRRKEETRASRQRGLLDSVPRKLPGAGGSAADQLQSRQRGLRLGKSRPGARQAGRRAARTGRARAKASRPPKSKAKSAICCSSW